MNIKIINNDFINYKFIKSLFIIFIFMNITSFLSQLWSPPTTSDHNLVSFELVCKRIVTETVRVKYAFNKGK